MEGFNQENTKSKLDKEDLYFEALKANPAKIIETDEDFNMYTFSNTIREYDSCNINRKENHNDSVESLSSYKDTKYFKDFQEKLKNSIKETQCTKNLISIRDNNKSLSNSKCEDKEIKDEDDSNNDLSLHNKTNSNHTQSFINALTYLKLQKLKEKSGGSNNNSLYCSQPKIIDHESYYYHDKTNKDLIDNSQDKSKNNNFTSNDQSSNKDYYVLKFTQLLNNFSEFKNSNSFNLFKQKQDNSSSEEYFNSSTIYDKSNFPLQIKSKKNKNNIRKNPTSNDAHSKNNFRHTKAYFNPGRVRSNSRDDKKLNIYHKKNRSSSSMVLNCALDDNNYDRLERKYNNNINISNHISTKKENISAPIETTTNKTSSEEYNSPFSNFNILNKEYSQRIITNDENKIIKKSNSSLENIIDINTRNNTGNNRAQSKMTVKDLMAIAYKRKSKLVLKDKEDYNYSTSTNDCNTYLMKENKEKLIEDKTIDEGILKENKYNDNSVLLNLLMKETKKTYNKDNLNNYEYSSLSSNLINSKTNKPSFSVIYPVNSNSKNNNNKNISTNVHEDKVDSYFKIDLSNSKINDKLKEDAALVLNNKSSNNNNNNSSNSNLNKSDINNLKQVKHCTISIKTSDLGLFTNMNNSNKEEISNKEKNKPSLHTKYGSKYSTNNNTDNIINNSFHINSSIASVKVASNIKSKLENSLNYNKNYPDVEIETDNYTRSMKRNMSSNNIHCTNTLSRLRFLMENEEILSEEDRFISEFQYEMIRKDNEFNILKERFKSLNKKIGLIKRLKADNTSNNKNDGIKKDNFIVKEGNLMVAPTCKYKSSSNILLSEDRISLNLKSKLDDFDNIFKKNKKTDIWNPISFNFNNSNKTLNDSNHENVLISNRLYTDLNTNNSVYLKEQSSPYSNKTNNEEINSKNIKKKMNSNNYNLDKINQSSIDLPPKCFFSQITKHGLNKNSNEFDLNINLNEIVKRTQEDKENSQSFLDIKDISNISTKQNNNFSSNPKIGKPGYISNSFNLFTNNKLISKSSNNHINQENKINKDIKALNNKKNIYTKNINSNKMKQYDIVRDKNCQIENNRCNTKNTTNKNKYANVKSRIFEVKEPKAPCNSNINNPKKPGKASSRKLSNNKKNYNDLKDQDSFNVYSNNNCNRLSESSLLNNIEEMSELSNINNSNNYNNEFYADMVNDNFSRLNTSDFNDSKLICEDINNTNKHAYINQRNKGKKVTNVKKKSINETGYKKNMRNDSKKPSVNININIRDGKAEVVKQNNCEDEDIKLNYNKLISDNINNPLIPRTGNLELMKKQNSYKSNDNEYKSDNKTILNTISTPVSYIPFVIDSNLHCKATPRSFSNLRIEPNNEIRQICSYNNQYYCSAKMNINKQNALVKENIDKDFMNKFSRVIDYTNNNLTKHIGLDNKEDNKNINITDLEILTIPTDSNNDNNCNENNNNTKQELVLSRNKEKTNTNTNNLTSDIVNYATNQGNTINENSNAHSSINKQPHYKLNQFNTKNTEININNKDKTSINDKSDARLLNNTSSRKYLINYSNNNKDGNYNSLENNNLFDFSALNYTTNNTNKTNNQIIQLNSKSQITNVRCKYNEKNKATIQNSYDNNIPEINNHLEYNNKDLIESKSKNYINTILYSLKYSNSTSNINETNNDNNLNEISEISINNNSYYEINKEENYYINEYKKSLKDKQDGLFIINNIENNKKNKNNEINSISNITKEDKIIFDDELLVGEQLEINDNDDRIIKNNLNRNTPSNESLLNENNKNEINRKYSDDENLLDSKSIINIEYNFKNSNNNYYKDNYCSKNNNKNCTTYMDLELIMENEKEKKSEIYKNQLTIKNKDLIINKDDFNIIQRSQNSQKYKNLNKEKKSQGKSDFILEEKENIRYSRDIKFISSGKNQFNKRNKNAFKSLAINKEDFNIFNISEKKDALFFIDDDVINKENDDKIILETEDSFKDKIVIEKSQFEITRKMGSNCFSIEKNDDVSIIDNTIFNEKRNFKIENIISFLINEIFIKSHQVGFSLNINNNRISKESEHIIQSTTLKKIQKGDSNNQQSLLPYNICTKNNNFDLVYYKAEEFAVNNENQHHSETIQSNNDDRKKAHKENTAEYRKKNIELIYQNTNNIEFNQANVDFTINKIEEKEDNNRNSLTLKNITIDNKFDMSDSNNVNNKELVKQDFPCIMKNAIKYDKYKNANDEISNDGFNIKNYTKTNHYFVDSLDSILNENEEDYKSKNDKFIIDCSSYYSTKKQDGIKENDKYVLITDNNDIDIDDEKYYYKSYMITQGYNNTLNNESISNNSKSNVKQDAIDYNKDNAESNKAPTNNSIIKDIIKYTEDTIVKEQSKSLIIKSNNELGSKIDDAFVINNTICYMMNKDNIFLPIKDIKNEIQEKVYIDCPNNKDDINYLIVEQSGINKSNKTNNLHADNSNYIKKNIYKDCKNDINLNHYNSNNNEDEGNSNEEENYNELIGFQQVQESNCDFYIETVGDIIMKDAAPDRKDKSKNILIIKESNVNEEYCNNNTAIKQINFDSKSKTLNNYSVKDIDQYEESMKVASLINNSQQFEVFDITNSQYYKNPNKSNDLNDFNFKSIVKEFADNDMNANMLFRNTWKNNTINYNEETYRNDLKENDYDEYSFNDHEESNVDHNSIKNQSTKNYDNFNEKDTILQSYVFTNSYYSNTNDRNSNLYYENYEKNYPQSNLNINNTDINNSDINYNEEYEHNIYSNTIKSNISNNIDLLINKDKVHFKNKEIGDKLYDKQKNISVLSLNSLTNHTNDVRNNIDSNIYKHHNFSNMNNILNQKTNTIVPVNQIDTAILETFNGENSIDRFKKNQVAFSQQLKEQSKDYNKFKIIYF